MNRKISIVTYNVFGTLDEKKYLKDEKKYIINEIFKNNIPDVICLRSNKANWCNYGKIT